MQAAPKPTLRFRHLAGEPYKNKIENIKPSSVSTESCMARGNSTYFAYAPQVGGGGSVAVLPNTLSGKMPALFPMVRGHQGAIHDFDFSPFNDNILATASEDMTLKIWQIPETYATDTFNAPPLDEAAITFNAHNKRTSLLAWHPAAENVIATTSLDKTTKVWDIGRPDAVTVFDANAEPWLSLDWDITGQLLGGATKDRRLKIIDGRSKAVVHDGPAHEGPKSTKMLFLGNTDYVFTVGFSKGSEREWKLWDKRKLDVAHATKIIDNQASVLYPFFDHDLNLLFLAGKGDGNIRHYELVDGMLYQNLNDFMAQYPGKCYGFYPKRAVNVMKTEVDRAIKVCDSSIEFIAFSAPRRGEGFYEELFPDCLSEEPAMKAAEWFGGANLPPKRRSMNPKDPAAPKRHSDSLKSPLHAQGTGLTHGGNEELNKKILQLEHTVAQLQDKITHLEKENASLTLVNQTQKDELAALHAKHQ